MIVKQLHTDRQRRLAAELAELRPPQESLGSRAYDRELPWNRGVEGSQVMAFINDDFEVFRMQAGAGTGKTFGLRKRVLRIGHPDGLAVPHERVLVCAFNRVIARDLEREIRAEFEPHGLPLPTIRTVHSLCTTLLKGEAPRLTLPHETDEMMYDVLATHPRLRDQYTQPRAVRVLVEPQRGFEIASFDWASVKPQNNTYVRFDFVDRSGNPLIPFRIANGP